MTPPITVPTPRRSRRRKLLGTTLAALIALIGTVAGFPDRVRASGPVSPLIWGENLALDSGSGSGDWFLSSSALRTALRTAHTQIIRMPVRGPNPDTAGWANEAEFKAAAGYVQQAGMVPLVILRNPEAPQALATDEQVTDYLRGLFGDQPVYYEFGNETDLNDGTGNYVTAASYVTQWNAQVPALKARAGAGARFLGPANYQYDESYLRTFLTGARPAPDAISWHLYTCGRTESESACLDAGGIDDWPARFAQARTVMRDTVGAELPIWVTEWNFNPSSDVTSDPKLADQSFLRAWTLKALKTLADNGVAASMHYNVAGAVPLATANGTLTAEGQAFKDQYEALAAGSSTPTPTPSTPTPSSPAPSSPSPSSPGPSSPSPSSPGAAPVYSFEDGGVDGWSKTGNVTGYANSTEAGGQDGNHALKVTFLSSSGNDFPYVQATPGTGPVAGQSYSAYLYLPASTTASVTARLFVQDSAYAWHTAPSTVVSQRGSWTRLSYSPSGYTGPARQVGLQFSASPANTSATVYIDSVTW